MDDREAREIATRAAIRGGRVALEKLGDPGYLTWKGHRDVVAGASLEVQEAILDVLRQECPSDVILAEEGPLDEPLDVDAARLWIVDPVCGSLNFIQGIPLFAVAVALRVNGVLRIGVVHDPVRQETFAAEVGEPATLNGRSIAVMNTALGPEFWEQAWVGTDLPHDGAQLNEALTVFGLISKEVLHHVVLGSPALGMCYVACGRLHAYWNLHAQPWDVAASGLILRQAGGLLTDAEGGSWIHSPGSYVAANPASHQWALRIIKVVREPSTKPRKALEA